MTSYMQNIGTMKYKSFQRRFGKKNRTRKIDYAKYVRTYACMCKDYAQVCIVM